MISALGEEFLEIVGVQREEEHLKALSVCCQSGTQLPGDLRGHRQRSHLDTWEKWPRALGVTDQWQRQNTE